MELLNEYDSFNHHAYPSTQVYRYMVYLRHHGFPSPLLDWTTSPYIAAFFAFREPCSVVKCPQKEDPKQDARSIYLFCEYSPCGFKATGSGAPQIRRMGPYVDTHARHFRQRADYTMCADFTQAGWVYADHEGVMRSSEDQDALWRFNMPEIERVKVLSVLDEYNIKAYSLFDSEESLIETMAMRTLTLSGEDKTLPVEPLA